ncbi:MAG: hypothetical protein KAR47_00965 [Planctomycetes bacterium]|nr:hypothetical protein [Planctomycetota bacterium]
MRQDKRKKLRTGLWKWAAGVTLVELITTMIIAVIPLSSVTVLVIGGQHSWGKTYLSANRKIKSDAEASCAMFGKLGRKSDGENTALIASLGKDSRSGGIGSISVSNSYGTGIEFRYWDTPQQYTTTASKGGRVGRSGIIAATTTAKTGIVPTEYARFYLSSDDKLNLDYGPYPYDTMTRQVTRTVVIAENVTRVKFHRTIENNVGHGCVKMEITLRDPNDGKVITMKTATLMRN